jgi:hypothetical protein
VALLAGHVHVRQEVHLDLDLAIAAADLAASTDASPVGAFRRCCFSRAIPTTPGRAALAARWVRFPRASERGYCWVAKHRSLFGPALLAASRRWAEA